MIKVTVELDKHGKGEEKKVIGLIIIANDGTGTVEEGNYAYALSHAGKHMTKKGVFKSGKIKGFKRSLSPYRLLYRILKDAKET